jgi:hypothetical protein
VSRAWARDSNRRRERSRTARQPARASGLWWISPEVWNSHLQECISCGKPCGTTQKNRVLPHRKIVWFPLFTFLFDSTTFFSDRDRRVEA